MSFHKRETSKVKDFEATKNACHEQKQAFLVYLPKQEGQVPFGRAPSGEGTPPQAGTDLAVSVAHSAELAKADLVVALKLLS